MDVKNVIFGVTTTALLVVGLGATRLMKLDMPDEELELIEITPVSLAPPPEPMLIEEVQEVVDTMAPPPPSFADLRPNISIETLSLPSASEPIALDAEVDLFSQDVAPAALPTLSKSRAKPKVSIKPRVSQAKPANSIGIQDLDSKPRVLRLGRYRWPSSVRDSQVKAKVVVEIDRNGAVKLLRVESVSHPSFKSVLPKLVHGCRFSVPKYKGQSVKVAYTWNLILQKP